jgi:cell pole-organizing protein PopZ
MVTILGALLVVSGAGFAAARTMTGPPWQQPVFSAMGCETTDGSTGGTETPAPEPTETETPEAAETETPEATETEAPEATETEAPEATETEAPEATETEAPEATETEAPEATETEAPAATDTETAEATESPDATDSEVADATETESPEPTETEAPEASATEAPEGTEADSTEDTPTTVDCADDTDSADPADTKAVFAGDCGSAALGERQLTGSSTDADAARAFGALADALSSGQRDHMVQSVRVLLRNCEAHANDGLRNALYHHGLNWMRHYDHELWLEQKFADKWPDGKPGGGHDATAHGKPDKTDKTHGNPHDADPSWAPGGGSSSSHGNGNGK